MKVIKYCLNILICLDQMVNCILSPLLNMMLEKDAEVRFGNPGQTLSKVFKENSLMCTPCYYIHKVLGWLDPSQKLKDE